MQNVGLPLESRKLHWTQHHHFYTEWKILAECRNWKNHMEMDLHVIFMQSEPDRWLTSPLMESLNKKVSEEIERGESL